MYCFRKVTDDLIWVGANDRRLAMFEGVYSVPGGVSYNSYLLLDEKTVLFDTVDAAVGTVFFENVEKALDGRHLDYIVVHHMEPDHSATLEELVRRYPDVKIICNQKLAVMMKQYFTFDVDGMTQIVKEGDNLYDYSNGLEEYKNGFVVNSTLGYSDSIPAGNVIGYSGNIKEGDKQEYGSAITINVSLGKKPESATEQTFVYKDRTAPAIQ